MNNAVYEKCEKTQKYKVAITEKRRNYLASEPNYHTTKFFTEISLGKEREKLNINA